MQCNMNISFSPPDIGEEEITAVVDTLRSGWITTGPKTKEFEKNIAAYCNTNRAVCLNSATSCAEMTLRILGIGPEDEVITSAYTYTASASVVCHVGAKLVLVDTQKDSYEMDYDALENAITERTKVIIPVDIAGVMCNYDRIYDIVNRKRKLFSAKNEIQSAFGRIIIVADGAHAFGASYHQQRCGSVADFTSFSFHAVKNLTTAEGGAVTWRKIEGIEDETLYHQYQLLSLHGQSKDAFAKMKLGAWEYDIIDTYYKCNMMDIQAAIGLIQLVRYPKLLERRQAIVAQYNQGLKQLPVSILKHNGVDFQSSTHLYLVRLDGRTMEERNAMICKMAEKGVATNVHYKPLPMLTAYRKLGFDILDYPNAYAQFKNEITLPLHTRLTDEEVRYVINAFQQSYREVIA